MFISYLVQFIWLVYNLLFVSINSTFDIAFGYSPLLAMYLVPSHNLCLVVYLHGQSLYLIYYCWIKNHCGHWMGWMSTDINNG